MSEKLAATGYTHHPGLHCESTAARNAWAHAGLDLSEEMIFGLGEGLGFVYWFMQGKKVAMPYPFVGWRGGKVAELISRASAHLGIACKAVETKSEASADKNVRRLLAAGSPALIYVDMAYLPYMRLPQDGHFGGHSIVLYELDESAGLARVSDVLNEPQTLTLEDLRAARSSAHQPFPPRNRHMEFTFPEEPPGLGETVLDAIRANAATMANPPISDLGLKGIQRFAKEIKKWPQMLSPESLLWALVSTFVYIEIGGTGGGAFRPMYGRFLKEIHALTGRAGLLEAAGLCERSGELLSALGVALMPDDMPGLATVRRLMLERDHLLKRDIGAAKEKRLASMDGEMNGAVAGALAEEIPRYEAHLPAVVEAIEAVHAAEAAANAALLA